ncbi:hypothetical protein MTR_3g437090 [Medicago truncatula]|uniref:Uncharacterized protein n=1 Tax=Medicago truncatula TaxID=3880 RepID=A0A072UWH2_MEDTR|nr:hypothetical protein MTR_3g437090 [Medicago truncatula]
MGLSNMCNIAHVKKNPLNITGCLSPVYVLDLCDDHFGYTLKDILQQENCFFDIENFIKTQVKYVYVPSSS